jgi:hypothetical protein
MMEIFTSQSLPVQLEKEIPVKVACANCGTPVELNYCPACGQRHLKGRFRMVDLASEFFHNYLGTDSGLLFTFREMLLRPGHAVNQFLDGRRKPYLKPVQFYLLMLTFYFVVSEVLNVNLLEMSQELTSSFGYSPSPEKLKSEAVQSLQTVLTENIKVIFTILFFLLAWSLRVFYRKKKYNYTELLVFTLYTYGISFALASVQTALFAISLPKAAHLVIFFTFYALSNAYLVWAIHQFFGGRGWKSWGKSLFVYLFSSVMFFLFSGVAGAVFGFTYAYLHKH